MSFTDSDLKRIKEATDLAALVEADVKLRKSGAKYYGDCPFCEGKKKLAVIERDKYWRCAKCEESGDAIRWLTKLHKMDFIEAVKTLAGKAHIHLYTEPGTKRDPRYSFRDAQLIASGISNKAQLSIIREINREIEIDRYQSGTEVQGRIVEGDDMILRYIGLDRKPIYYYPPKSGKNGVEFYRIRYANPERDKKFDRDGKPTKYRSPKGGGNHLWLPEYIIRAYEIGQQIKTLVVVEGEKKSDKLCIDGIPAVGIAGIHNFSAISGMPNEFALLINKCGIRQVVFMLDSDCQDIKINVNESLDNRPRTFASAAFKFYEYFDGYRNEGIEIRTFIAWHNDRARKGIDDLLTYEHGKTKEITEDLTASLADVKHQSQWWTVHRLNDFTVNKIQEIWHVNNTQTFIEHYKQQIIDSGIGKFKLKGHWYNVNEDGSIEESNTLRDADRYWRAEIYQVGGREKTKYTFYNRGFHRFLKGHKIGRIKIDESKSQKFVRVDNNLVREVSNDDIRDFVMDYTEEISFLDYFEKEEILEMMIRGSVQYFSDAMLRNMKELDINFYQPRPDEQLLIFQTKYWRITADSIEECDLDTLPGQFWLGKQIECNPKLIENAMDIELKNGSFKIDVCQPVRNSDFFRYLWNTSFYKWRDYYKEIKDEETGLVRYERYKEIDSPEDLQQIIDNLVPKLIAMGYITTDYINYANLKAIVAMDNAESEVGKSKGGSGKSIFGQQFTYWKPSHRIDGKKKDLEHDTFLYDGMDESTELIFFDDCRVNMDFETFFSQITAGIIVNSKGIRKKQLSPRKMLFTTNHSLWGRDDSTRRRQYLITFSDYYNINRTPYTEFGRQMFVEWEGEDYSLYFNIVAKAIQANLKFGLQYTIPGEDVKRRSLRQEIGEDFLDWAATYFNEDDTSEEPNIGRKISILDALSDFYNSYPKQKNFVNLKKFRDKCKMLCEYRGGYHFNPHANKDGRIRSGSTEYIIIAREETEAISNIEPDKLPF